MAFPANSRLEAATSRLEDIVVYESQTLETVPGSAVSKAESIAPTDGSVTPATTTPPAQTGPISAPLPESITEFDNILVKDLVGRYVGLSAEIGDLVAEQVYFSSFSQYTFFGLLVIIFWMTETNS